MIVKPQKEKLSQEGKICSHKCYKLIIMNVQINCLYMLIKTIMQVSQIAIIHLFRFLAFQGFDREGAKLLNHQIS